MHDIPTLQRLACQGYLLTLALEYVDDIGRSKCPKSSGWPRTSDQEQFVLDLCVTIDCATIIETDSTEVDTREIIDAVQKELNELLSTHAAWPPEKCRGLLSEKVLATRFTLAEWLRRRLGLLANADAIDVDYGKKDWLSLIAELDGPEKIEPQRFKQLFSISRTLRYAIVSNRLARFGRSGMRGRKSTGASVARRE